MTENDYPWITRVHPIGSDNLNIIPSYETYVGYPSSKILVIGHSNSGNHWLRDICRRLKIEFASSHVAAGTRSTYTFEAIKKKILETPNILNLQTSKVIFIYRDPRDVMVSSFCSRANKKVTIETQISNILANSSSADKVTKLKTLINGSPSRFHSISDMIRDPQAGIEKCIQYNLFMMSYLKDAHFVKYENLKANTFSEIKSIIDFLKLNISDESIVEAIDYCSFENMQAREIQVKINDGKNYDPEKLKYRKGISGGYTNYLTADDIDYCNSLLKKYNYYV